jgi:hypothetical protein
MFRDMFRDIGSSAGTRSGANPRFAGDPPAEMHHNVPVFKIRNIDDDDDDDDECKSV